MRAADLPDEFHGPIGHSDLWLWLALLALAVVALYYAGVSWWARPRRTPAPAAPVPAPAPPPTDPRPAHLAELDRIAREVADRTIPARVGHQAVSRTVRSYVGAVSPLPADRMTLSDLRSVATGTRTVLLADAVELMYPPSFAPGEEGHATERFAEAMARAQHLVRTW
jgi:hypothetical protein